MQSYKNQNITGLGEDVALNVDLLLSYLCFDDDSTTGAQKAASLGVGGGFQRKDVSQIIATLYGQFKGSS